MLVLTGIPVLLFPTNVSDLGHGHNIYKGQLPAWYPLVTVSNNTNSDRGDGLDSHWHEMMPRAVVLLQLITIDLGRGVNWVIFHLESLDSDTQMNSRVYGCLSGMHTLLWLKGPYYKTKQKTPLTCPTVWGLHRSAHAGSAQLRRPSQGPNYR